MIIFAKVHHFCALKHLASFRSDIAWKSAKYAQIWEYLRDEYELTQRFGSLDYKLKFVEVNLESFLLLCFFFFLRFHPLVERLIKCAFHLVSAMLFAAQHTHLPGYSSESEISIYGVSNNCFDCFGDSHLTL